MFRKPYLLTLILGLIFMVLPGPAQSSGEISGHWLGGPMDAPVRMEVFSDFQCTHCRSFYLGTIRPILRDYASKSKVCVIYHEFPLRSNPYSLKAAQYSEAAYRLGRQKLLQVMDSMYSEQDTWSQDGNLEQIVAEALSSEDMEKLNKILQDPSINQSISEGVELGNQREVRSTPTTFFYYIGKEQKVEGAVTYTILKQFIDQIVK